MLTTDSPVLPPGNVAQPHDDEPDEAEVLDAQPPLEMDAFALATAVAASHSRSTFSIPPSVQSTGALHSLGTSEIPVDLPRTPAYRRPSPATEASAGYRSRMTLKVEVQKDFESGQGLLPDHSEHTRTRRVSAPQPSIWRSPRPQPVRTISSRVDVGEDGRKHRSLRQPVFVKVRRIGERLRGLFKSKGEPASRGSPGMAGAAYSPEYGLMTTTTAVTNVEYESEHPIPLPSPRARIMRNHRRSLPLPLLLASAERLVHSTIADPPSETDPVPELQPTVTVQRSDEPASPTRGLEDPCRSPRTPKARRERTQTAPHSVETEKKPIKSRRFSLSSALTKSRMESLRSAVVPRPPLPGPVLASQSKLSVATNLARHPSAPGSNTSAPHNRVTLVGEDPPHEGLWGGELPAVQDLHDGPIIRVISDDSPARSRMHTAPSPSALPPQSNDDTAAAKHKRSRRFSLSSMMAKRSSRAVPQSSGQHLLPCAHPQSSRRRPRGDTVTTITHGSVQFDMVHPRTRFDIGPWPAVPTTLPSHRSSLVSQSSGAESTYYDAQEIASEDDDHGFALERSCSPRPESDLDSMSFARTPDHSSGTFSFGSSTEREFYLETSDLSTSSYTYRPYACPNVSRLVGGSSSTPITKTLRFSPSLTLSFDMSCSGYEDDDEMGRLEQEEELSFMRTLGFEFDEIARRVREESL
ncbi:hypothetical protein L226DRAFT_565182 [Lentinus tigrinus ALCF2SS1-7]|uniref:uncharacterized protein n=1 Tax=Lentinus tigrinus ALCF2SS1-7 TaxID=1328758 RepID=UPI001166229C|nr:hypothetical protein L226DRAFT_565182 [Lentinus tigrinus ALCF2SS1-7]